MKIDTTLLLEIQQLSAEHAYRIDHNQADTLHELFAERGSLLGLPPKDLIGRDAIAAWGVERVKLARTCRHMETNHRVYLEGDRILGTVYATVYRTDSEDTTNTAPFMIGDYEDEYVVENGRVVFLTRTIKRAFRVGS